MIRSKQFPARPSGSRVGVVLLLIALVFACVAVLSSKAGFPLLSFEPLVALTRYLPFVNPQPSLPPLDSPPNASSSFENTLTLERQSWYAIQVGAYDTQDAAAEAAATLRARGGAGYVIQDGAYRLLVACYPSRAEAEEVMNRLVSSGEYGASAIYRLNADEMIISLIATPLQASALSQAYSLLPEMIQELSRLALALDRGSMDASAVRASAGTSMNRAKQLLSTMDLAITDPRPDIVRELRALLETAAATMEQIVHSDSGALPLSSQIKYNHVDLLWRYVQYVKRMSALGA
ncbi:MAG: SPOR domain-containing protein [Oscillospiraceae bacterium]|jgi:hypothetical protein|nr:SPOR domain-containing protein [Oscillospiraceae bacterium]